MAKTKNESVFNPLDPANVPAGMPGPMANFDEDQPRDDDGKWSSTGGGGGSAGGSVMKGFDKAQKAIDDRAAKPMPEGKKASGGELNARLRRQKYTDIASKATAASKSAMAGKTKEDRVKSHVKAMKLHWDAHEAAVAAKMDRESDYHREQFRYHSLASGKA